MTREPITAQVAPDIAALVGLPGSRENLPTPALVLDLDVMESNLSAMDRLLAGSSLTLRPHFKAHKCLEICRLQLEHGAAGFSAATVGEAEKLAPLGTSVLLTSVLASETNIARGADLRAHAQDVTFVVDSVPVAQRLNAALEARACTAGVLIDIDAGRHRAGCASIPAARELAEAVRRSSALALKGLQFYAGHLSHLHDPQRRAEGHAQFRSDLARYREALSEALPSSPIISGGSTGSLALELEEPVLTEMQCGSYALMDVEYLALPYSPGRAGWPFSAAVTVQSSVLSGNWPTHATADAGDKRFASKYGHPPRLTRVPPGITLESASYTPTGDEHGRLDFTDPSPPQPGARLECVVPHLDPSINLFDIVYAVSGETLIDVWDIAARGC
ncbi:hypothetical protein FCK90_13475 [Kocuria coralli]|uniref:D-serine dehydratase-like domain-containing protein n=1 Tax=Kocuria coralli TaxID=1461025 RepID=A0A5J5KUX1_9MICC|nr:alanine racemase [Kocuria coralli]KAA9393188.1 hypothetical protein FCK90_13475 [Kocuria coralli]